MGVKKPPEGGSLTWHPQPSLWVAGAAMVNNGYTRRLLARLVRSVRLGCCRSPQRTTYIQKTPYLETVFFGPACGPPAANSSASSETSCTRTSSSSMFIANSKVEFPRPSGCGFAVSNRSNAASGSSALPPAHHPQPAPVRHQKHPVQLLQVQCSSQSPRLSTHAQVGVGLLSAIAN